MIINHVFFMHFFFLLLDLQSLVCVLHLRPSSVWTGQLTCPERTWILCIHRILFSSLAPMKGSSLCFGAFLGSLLGTSMSFTPERTTDGKVSFNQLFQEKLISEEEGARGGRWGEVSGF